MHLKPACSSFCKNVGEAHKFFFSKHKDGTCSCKAIQLGCPSDTKAGKQPAKVKGQQKRLDIQNSSEDDDV